MALDKHNQNLDLWQEIINLKAQTHYPNTPKAHIKGYRTS